MSLSSVTVNSSIKKIRLRWDTIVGLLTHAGQSFHNMVRISAVSQ